MKITWADVERFIGIKATPVVRRSFVRSVKCFFGSHEWSPWRWHVGLPVDMVESVCTSCGKTVRDYD